MTNHEGFMSGDDHPVLPIFEETPAPTPELPPVVPARTYKPESDDDQTSIERPYDELGGGHSSWPVPKAKPAEPVRTSQSSSKPRALRPSGNVRFVEGSDSDHDPFWSAPTGAENPATEEQIKAALEDPRNLFKRTKYAKLLSDGLSVEEALYRMRADEEKRQRRQTPPRAS